jgi:hypothetical protein
VVDFESTGTVEQEKLEGEEEEERLFCNYIQSDGKRNQVTDFLRLQPGGSFQECNAGKQGSIQTAPLYSTNHVNDVHKSSNQATLLFLSSFSCRHCLLASFLYVGCISI